MNKDFLKSVDLKPVSKEIRQLINSLKNNNMRLNIPTNEISTLSKIKFVDLVNEFETENHHSVKKPKFLESLDSQHLNNVFRFLVKYHYEPGQFTLELLQKGIEFMNKNSKTPITNNIQFDIKRIIDYIGFRVINQYKKSLDTTVKKIKKNKELLDFKLELIYHRPELDLIKSTPTTTRIHKGISDRIKQVQGKFGKLNLISQIPQQKQRILSFVIPSIIR